MRPHPKVGNLASSFTGHPNVNGFGENGEELESSFSFNELEPNGE